jgi:hypothetical protein
LIPERDAADGKQRQRHDIGDSRASVPQTSSAKLVSAG